MPATHHKKPVFILAILAFFIIQACSESEKDLSSRERMVDLNRSIVTQPQVIGKIEEQGHEVVEEERSLKIGVIGPETGAQSLWGLSVLEGVQAAAGRFNRQGGINGQEIEVLHYNTEDTVHLTELAVKDLTRQKAIAIISAPTGWSTFAPTHIVNETHTIFISVGTRRRIGRSGPYVFRTSLPDELATDNFIKYTTETLSYTEYAMVTSSQYDYSLNLSSGFRKAIFKHGGTLAVDADTYDTFTGKQDLTRVIDAIKTRADTLHGVIFTGGGNEGVLFAGEMRKAGLNQPILGGEDLFTSEYLEGGDAVAGSLLYATFSPHSDSPMVAEFKQDYGKDNPDRFAALAYDTFMLIAQAIRTAGSTRTSMVRDAIVATRDFEGATGKTGFTPEGTPIKDPFIYRVITDGNGEKFDLLR